MTRDPEGFEYPATTDMPYGGYAHPVTDRGRRLSDAYTLARLVGGQGRWIAARLSDGTTDGQIYDSKADAVRHQIHETQCAYICIGPADMPPHEASAYLQFNEGAYRAGMRLTDPDREPVLDTSSMPAINRAMRRANRRNRKGI